jgi:hypothetical protein
MKTQSLSAASRNRLERYNLICSIAGEDSAVERGVHAASPSACMECGNEAG